MNLPMREKYVDEVVGIFFKFGRSKNGVDVSDGRRDVFSGLPDNVADQVVAAQARFRQELYQILCSTETLT